MGEEEEDVEYIFLSAWAKMSLDDEELFFITINYLHLIQV